ncbi:hypothetical protein SORBI_3002G145101 [Sorghum bicolor]|uniref:Uncharacterized protein n=1 Tax=Sorghum bicolor TaxID=4558 RepID=A0A1W0W421_SORBI|nr:hypothetical protein SORBI_3002G145101 [Sorghum bicolor]
MHTHTSPHPLSRFLRSPNTVADEATTPFPLHIWRRAGRDAVATALQFTGDGLRLRLLLAHPSASLSLSSPALPLVTIYQRRSFSASQIPEPNPPGIRSPLRADRRRILRPVQLPRRYLCCSLHALDLVCCKLQFEVLEYDLPCAAAVLTVSDLEHEVSTMASDFPPRFQYHARCSTICVHAARRCDGSLFITFVLEIPGFPHI